MSKNEYALLRKILKEFTFDEILEELEVDRFDALLFLVEEGVIDINDLEERL